jgi:hypothetical protein
VHKGQSESARSSARVYGAGHKLIGKNYQTPDLYAKVTGQAKYAEDYHAEGLHTCSPGRCSHRAADARQALLSIGPPAR